MAAPPSASFPSPLTLPHALGDLSAENRCQKLTVCNVQVNTDVYRLAPCPWHDSKTGHMIIASCGTLAPHWHSSSCLYPSLVRLAQDTANIGARGIGPLAGTSSQPENTNQPQPTKTLSLASISGDFAIGRLTHFLNCVTGKPQGADMTPSQESGPCQRALLDTDKMIGQTSVRSTPIPNFNVNRPGLSFRDRLQSVSKCWVACHTVVATCIVPRLRKSLSSTEYLSFSTRELDQDSMIRKTCQG